MTLLENADKPQEMVYVLLRLNEEWQKCEALTKRYNPNNTGDDEEESGDGISTNNNSNSTKSGNIVDEKNESPGKDAEEYFSRKSKKSGDSDSKRTASKKVESKKEKQQREEEEAKKNLNFEALDQSVYRIRKIPCNLSIIFSKCNTLIVRLWNYTSFKIKNCWKTITTNADNLAAVYFSTIIFCDIVIKYSASKTKRYFSNKENRREAREQPTTSTAKKTDTKPEYQLKLEEIEQFRFTRAQAKALIEQKTNKVKVMRKDKHSVSTRSQTSDRLKESADFKYLNQNEKNRVKQDKLNQLVSARESKVRRSQRTLSKRRVNLAESVYFLYYLSK
mgnify:CR=1 FL=1